MKVGPIRIEKEDEYQQWRVALTIQHLSYYTCWYPSHLYTKQEAIERFLGGFKVVHPAYADCELNRILDQARTALLFLEVSEME